MSPDEYLDDDERGRFSPRSVFSAGWFRALLVLGALAVVLVVAVPYLLQWLDSSPPPPRPQAKGPEQRVTPPPTGATIAPVPAAPPGAVPLPQEAVRETPPRPVAKAPEKVAKAPEKGDTPAAAPEPAPRASKEPVESSPAPARVEPRKAAPRSAKAEAPGRHAAAKAETEAGTAERPATGGYWVQVGAFKDAGNADRLATTLRDEKMPAEVARVTRGDAGASRHEVFVAGATAEAVTAALRGAGSARAVRGGVAVQPTLDLKDAVALSKRLSDEGLTVRIRRVAAGEGAAYHVVRVGPYPTRARADTARKEIAGKGLGGFVAQGPAR